MHPYQKAILFSLIRTLEGRIAANTMQSYPTIDTIVAEYSIDEFDGTTGQYQSLQAAMQRKLLRKGILLNQYDYNPDITPEELITQIQATIAYISDNTNYSRFINKFNAQLSGKASPT